MMWYLAIITSVLVANCQCCIKCDEQGLEARAKFRRLIQDQFSHETIEGFINIKQMAFLMQSQVMDYLVKDGRMMDKSTITNIVSEYRRSVNIIAGLEFTGVQLLHIIQLEFQKLEEKVRKIVEEAESRMCSNKQDFDKCGLLVETYIECDTCEEKKAICAGGPPSNQEYFNQCSCVCTKQTCFDLITGYSCTPCLDHASHLESAIDCGEKRKVFTEHEDAFLECSHQWYNKIHEGFKNHFLKNKDPEIIITDEPSIRLRDIQMHESGRYTCTTVLNSGVPIARHVYTVEVEKGSENVKEYHPRPTLPEYLDLPDYLLPELQDDEQPVVQQHHHDNTVFLAICGTVVVTLLLLSAICIFIFWWRNKKSIQPEEEEEDV